jgi:hypothetical protein
MQGAKLAVEVAAPISEDCIERHLVSDAEEQVDIGPAVLSAVRSRAGQRSSRDARVVLGEPEQLPPHRIPMIAGEDNAESSRHVAGKPVVKHPLRPLGRWPG